MSLTLSLYVGGRFARALLATFGIVAALVLLMNTIELLRRTGSRPVGFFDIAVMAMLQTPGIALTALPFMVLLAAMWCYGQLARSSELVVTRAAGVSVWALVAPVALVAALTGVAGLAVLNPIAAATTTRFETLEARHLSGRTSRLSLSDEGLWLRQGLGEGQTVIHARRSNANATVLGSVTMFVFGEVDTLTRRIDARTAVLEPRRWRLTDAVERPIAGVGETLGEVASAIAHPTLDVPTELTSEQILDSFAQPQSISFWALPGFIATLEASGFSAQRHILHWHGQLASPLLFCAMALIGASFSMRHMRFGGLGAMAFGAVMTGFAFYFFNDVSKALGASGAVPAMLGAWAPPLAAGFFALGLLLNLEDG